METLCASDHKGAPNIVEQITFGNNEYGSYNDKPATLKASSSSADGNFVVENRYTVRRLTPSEFARLQGFSSAWHENLKTMNPTDEEIVFWQNVWSEYARIKKKKPKSYRQVVKWLRDPYSDAAAYKMYGNAITVNVGAFVLRGVAEAIRGGI
jgi:DNA (cytosine-5)-methyltransferase 1